MKSSAIPLPPLILALSLAAGPALAAAPAMAAAHGATHPGAAASGAAGQDKTMPKGMAGMHAPDTLQWGDAPPVLPKGGKVAILDGDPFKSGPYVIRLKMPPGYKIPPHWHSRAENVTVISGMLSLGTGDTLDMKAAQTLKAGGFHAIPAEHHHYAFSRGGAVVQIHGEGPFDITYVNAADSPAPAPEQKPAQ